MSILCKMVRDLVIFDVHNKDHRRYAFEFIRTKSWKNSPVMFYVDNEYHDVVSMINDRLLNYYYQKDFEPLSSE
jgi:hypothetical protein